MALLKVRQFKDDVWITDEQAQKIIDARKAGNEPKVWTFGTLQIPAQDIRAVVLDSHRSKPDDNGRLHYDLNNPEHKQIIKDFETLLNGRTIEQYLYDEKIIVNQKPPYDKFGYAIVSDRTNDFAEAQKKWNGLQDLWGRRFYAEKMEHQSFFDGGECGEWQCKYCVGWFERNRNALIKKMSVGEPREVAPVVAEAEDEIRISDIPF